MNDILHKRWTALVWKLPVMPTEFTWTFWVIMKKIKLKFQKLVGILREAAEE